MESNKLVEKLEKEKSKRKFCEQKIIDLQKQLIQLEEKNHALKDNCARKNFALRQVDQLLTTNKNELDKYRAAKIAKINQLQGQLDETMSTLTNTQTELETGHLACSQLTEQNDKLNQHVAELERRVLFQSDETETIQTQLDDVSFEKQKVEQNLATMEKELNEKINTLQKTLENERGKVAKYEQEESAEKTRADKLQQNGEMMRVQLEQARVMRENSQKQLQQDRSQWQKKLSELGDQLKQAHDQVKLKNDEVERVKSEKNIATTTIETLEREVNTSKVKSHYRSLFNFTIHIQSEMDLLKTRFTNEKDKLEVYFRSVQKSQKIEWEKAAESRLSEAKRTLEYRNNELEMELSQVQQKAAHDLAQLDRRLKEDYQAKIKSFLQQHFNQGLDALGISAPSRRSSSPNISPINSARNMEPRPPLEPRPTAPPPTQATVEPPTRREQELRKMIRNLLSQAPQAPPVPAQLQQNYLSSRLTELSKDNTLTDQDKKSLQRLRQLMTDNL